ncbi:MAG: phenylalanine--tRNA ligase subunit beta [Acidimicrobiia bacterium]
MKVSWRWLSEFIVLPDDDPEQLAGSLASLGHEVEGYELLEPQFNGVVVARVTAIRAHPNADKVRLATIDFSSGELEVVCGAWNFDEGATVAYATVGSELAGGFKVDEREIRGVMSPGMIASERELGLADDHEGILLLDSGLELGSDVRDHVDLPDVVFDLSITPNRPDAMSMLGIARDLAAKFELEVRDREVEVTEQDPPSDLVVTIEDAEACPRFVARLARNVSVGPSPLWMRQRLERAGVRPISNVVDITNYVMLEMGQPLHAFDHDLVRGGQLRVHRAVEGTTMTTLDEVARDLDPDDIVISDAEGISSLAGVMGGSISEVGDATTNVLVEAANWHPPSILYTSKRHNLRTEASARFERGVDPNLPFRAATRATALLVELAGAEAASGVVDLYRTPVAPAEVALPIDEIERLLGTAFSSEHAANLLARLGLEVSGTDPLQVLVPTYRPDVTRPADLIEEIARLHGYDQFPATLPRGTGGGLSPAQTRERNVRARLVGAGLTEAATLSFMSAGDLDVLGVPADDERRLTIKVKNPLSEEEEILRSTLLPGLLKVAARNLSYGESGVALFEIGSVFLARPSPFYERLPDQPHHVGLLMTGQPGSPGLNTEPREADVFELTAVVENLLSGLGIQDFELQQQARAGYHPGRGAALIINGREAGSVGEIHPAAARTFGISGRVGVAEIALAPLLEPVPVWSLEEPSTYPYLQFDLAFELSDDIPSSSLIAAVHEAQAEVESVRLFDEFHLGDGRKSLAVRVVLRAQDRTLTNEEAAPVRHAIIQHVATRLGGTLRGAG